MRLLIAALCLSFAVAIVAAVFAIWPVVADAPWEDITQAPAPIVQPAPEATKTICDKLLDDYYNAGTDAALATANAALGRHQSSTHRRCER